MNYLDWHFGMKVVCVDASENSYSNPNGFIILTNGPWVVEGEVYTIETVYIDPDDGDVTVTLLGIYREPIGREMLAGITNSGFMASRFRPVQKRETSIAIFTALLNTQDELDEVPFA